MLLRYRTVITKATVHAGEEYAYELSIADDGQCDDAEIFLVVSADGHWLTPVALAVAETWEAAWEAAIDELPTIADEDLHDAYDCTAEEWAEHHRRADALVAECGATARGDYEWPELASGYTYKANFGNTNGIVHTDYLQMNPLTREDLETYSIDLQIRSHDAADAEREESEAAAAQQ